MPQLALSQHGCVRLAQRGIHLSDVDLILQFGTEVDDGFIVREKDCQEVERALKNILTRVRRIRGKRVVVADGCLVTAFHARRSEERRVLRERQARR